MIKLCYIDLSLVRKEISVALAENLLGRKVERMLSNSFCKWFCWKPRVLAVSVSATVRF